MNVSGWVGVSVCEEEGTFRVSLFVDVYLSVSLADPRCVDTEGGEDELANLGRVVKGMGFGVH
eukprot:m.437468 g.437468  ORF g.437468 m.437468 type:complete len:63 (-) comp111632_c0_seq1:28-216(-)